MVRAYEEWFAGYRDDPRALLARTFEEVGGYADMVPDVAMVTKRLLGDFNADPLRGDLMAATGL